MKCHSHLTIILVVALLSINLELIDSQCTKLLESYFNCFNLTANQTEVPESFYASALANYSTSDEAFEFFKSIYTTLNGCSTPKCQCVQKKLPLTPNYTVFFTNVSYFNDMKIICNELKENYKTRNIAKLKKGKLSSEISSIISSIRGLI